MVFRVLLQIPRSASIPLCLQLPFSDIKLVVVSRSAGVRYLNGTLQVGLRFRDFGGLLVFIKTCRAIPTLSRTTLSEHYRGASGGYATVTDRFRHSASSKRTCFAGPQRTLCLFLSECVQRETRLQCICLL